MDDLGRYLNQLTPVAKDISVEKNGSVRNTSLACSKGLTVKAAIKWASKDQNHPKVVFRTRWKELRGSWVRV